MGLRRAPAAALALLALLASGACRDADPDADPEKSAVAAHVGSAACAGCHPAESEAWAGSHHDRAMQVATEESVLGDFGDATFTHAGVTSRFFRRAGGFFVRTEGPDGALADFEITHTFGVEPLQQYLIPQPGGRLQALGIAWDARPRERGGQRWMHLYPDDPPPPGDALHWTGRYQTWNAMCAECHSTDLRKRYDPEADVYDTRWSEIDVACEACHGPGADHVRWARDAAAADAGGDTPAAPGFAAAFAAEGARGEVDACARCHARRERVSPEDAVGRPFLDDFAPALLREGLYFADGQIRDEVYVYGSFLQSPMYAAGVRCSDCHDPHSLEPRAEGDALCLRCHGEEPEPGFEAAAGAYASPAHHLHPVASPGARCAACHMPARTYMRVDPRRDHGFRAPRPDLTASLGVPNACGECHADRPPAWAASALAERFGAPPPHFAGALAAGRAGERGAAAPLAALAADAQRPAIVRASALELLARHGPAAEPALARAVDDPAPLVRLAAAGGFGALPPARRLPAAPLLEDPLRAVRVEAARVLAAVPSARLAVPQRRAFARALRELDEAQRATSDLPGGWMNRALLAEARGRPEAAARAYGAALRLDPDFLPARSNLALLHNREGRNDAAERELREALRRAPAAGELHYSLGLLLAEEERWSEAADSLGRAAAQLPGRARVHYNRGLALERLGRLGEAEAALRAAVRLAPGDPDAARALAALRARRRAAAPP